MLNVVSDDDTSSLTVPLPFQARLQLRARIKVQHERINFGWSNEESVLGFQRFLKFLLCFRYRDDDQALSLCSEVQFAQTSLNLKCDVIPTCTQGTNFAYHRNLSNSATSFLRAAFVVDGQELLRGDISNALSRLPALITKMVENKMDGVL